MQIENILYRDIDNPQDYEFYLMRTCTCNENWKTIGVVKGEIGKVILKTFRDVRRPTGNIPNNQMVTLYSE